MSSPVLNEAENSSVNSTAEVHSHGKYSVDTSVVLSLLCLHVISFCVALLGNISVVVLALRYWGRSKANFYVIAMAVSDIILLVWCVPFTLFTNLINHKWIFGDLMCSTVSFIQVACVIQRSFTLIASSFDRHQAICRPLRKQPTKRIAIFVILAIGAISLIIPSPIAYFSQIYTDDNNSSALCLEVWPNEAYRTMFSEFLLVLTYVIPLVVMTLTYAHIGYVLSSKPPGEESKIMMERRKTSRRKTFKVFIYSFFAYAICWLPIHVITLVGDVNSAIYDNKYVHVLWLCAHWLAMTNSAVTPIIVLALRSGHQQHLVSHFLRRKSSLLLSFRRRRSTLESLISLKK